MSVPFLPSGLQLLRTLGAQGRTYSCGIAEIDQLLGGGVTSGQVMEVIGSSTTGKTHICHAMAARVAASHPLVLGHRVLYIDCAGHFSVARLLACVERECRLEKEAGDSEEFHVAQTMRRISVIRCVSLADLVNGFEKLLSKVKESHKSGQFPSLSTVDRNAENLPELIIIDSLASSFSLMPLSAIPDERDKKIIDASSTDDDSPQRNRSASEKLIAKFSLLVRQVAVTANLAVVITNPIPVPQLLFSGSYFNAWTSAPHIRLFLELTAPQPNKSGNNSKVPSVVKETDAKRQRFATLRHHSGSRYTISELTHLDQSIQFSTPFILP